MLKDRDCLKQGVRLWLCLMLLGGGFAADRQLAAVQTPDPAADPALSSAGEPTDPVGETGSDVQKDENLQQTAQPPKDSPTGSSTAPRGEANNPDTSGKGTKAVSDRSGRGTQADAEWTRGWLGLGVVTLLGLVALAGLLYWMRGQGPRVVSRREGRDADLSSATEAQIRKLFASLLSQELSNTNTVLWQVRDFLQKLEAKIDRLDRKIPGVAKRSDVRSPAELDFDFAPEDHGNSDIERRLLDIVNRWWQESGTDRSFLDELLEGTPFECLMLHDLDRTFRQPTGQTYRFRSSNKTPEWLGFRDPGSGFLLVVPLDVKFFQAGNSIQIVRNLFHGVGATPSKFRFRRARKACRLESVPGEDSTYKATERGELELDPPAAVALPSAPIASSASSSAGESRQDDWAVLLPRLQALFEMTQQKVDISVADIAQRLTSLESLSLDLGSGVSALRQDVARLQEQVELLVAEENFGARSMGPFSDCRVEELGSSSRQETATEGAYNRTTEVRPRPMTELAMPSSSARGTAKEFSDSIREGLVELFQQGAKILEAVGEKAAEQYLEQLVALGARIARDVRFKGMVIQLVHLQPGSTSEDEPRVKLDAAEPDLGMSSARAASTQYRGMHLFQFGLTVSQEYADVVAFLISRGAAPSRFPTGFARLMEPTAQAGGQVVRLVEPAILRRQDPMSNLYVVERPLRVELESLENV